MLNQECVRVLLLYLDQQLVPRSTGRRPKPIKLKHAVSQSPLSGYPSADIFAAAEYIVGKGFAQIAAKELKDIPHIAPRHYVFTSLTPKGSDFLMTLRDDTVWQKMSDRLGNVFEATMPQLLATAADLGLKLFSG